MTEIKRGDFLNFKGGLHPKSQVDFEREFFRTGEESAAQVTVRTVNELKDRLGFSLEMKLEPSTEHQGYNVVTFTPSQPVHHDFFTGSGVFWSALRSIDTGIRMIKKVSSQDAQTIFKAEMAKINTMQLIGGEIQRPTSPDRQGQWQAAMGEIQSQLARRPVNSVFPPLRR